MYDVHHIHIRRTIIWKTIFFHVMCIVYIMYYEKQYRSLMTMVCSWSWSWLYDYNSMFKWMIICKISCFMHVWVECGNWCTFDRYHYLNKRPRGTSTWSYKKVIFVKSNWFCSNLISTMLLHNRSRDVHSIPKITNLVLKFLLWYSTSNLLLLAFGMKMRKSMLRFVLFRIYILCRTKENQRKSKPKWDDWLWLAQTRLCFKSNDRSK